MDAATPDLQGFRDAQRTLREQFGEDITFAAPASATWPAGTPIDPETSKPYDPTIEPEDGGEMADVGTIRCSIVYRPMGLSRRGIADDIQTTAVGNFEEGAVVLIADPTEYADAGIEDATQFVVHGETYAVSQTEDDQLGPGDTQRVLIYGEQM